MDGGSPVSCCGAHISAFLAVGPGLKVVNASPLEVARPKLVWLRLELEVVVLGIS